MSKVFDTVGHRRRHLQRRRRLNHLKRAVNNQDESNPISLLNILMEEKRGEGRVNEKNVAVRFLYASMKFMLKVTIVVGLLYMAALVFAYLEDDEFQNSQQLKVSQQLKNSERFQTSEKLQNNTRSHNITAVVKGSSNTSIFWSLIEHKHDVMLTISERNELEENIAELVENLKMNKIEVKHRRDLSHLRIQKWFYFVVVASTTIGYGDVCPTTQQVFSFFLLLFFS